MKFIHKSYKFRISPNVEQQVLLAKHFGATRFVFNHYLNKRKETYLENKTSLNYYDNANDLTLIKKDENYQSKLVDIDSKELYEDDGNNYILDDKSIDILLENYYKLKSKI